MNNPQIQLVALSVQMNNPQIQLAGLSVQMNNPQIQRVGLPVQMNIPQIQLALMPGRRTHRVGVGFYQVDMNDEALVKIGNCAELSRRGIYTILCSGDSFDNLACLNRWKLTIWKPITRLEPGRISYTKKEMVRGCAESPDGLIGKKMSPQQR